MVHHHESFQSGFSFFHDYNAIDARNGHDPRRGAVHLPSLYIPEDFAEKRPLPADHLASSCVKKSGSVVSEVPPGRDGNSFLSGVLNIKWHREPATPPERVRLAPGELPEIPVPVSPVP